MDQVMMAYLLILLGLLLLVAEVFLPTGGVLFVLAVVAILLGISMAFNVNPSAGLGTVITVFIAVPIVLTIAFHYWPKTPIGQRFFLQAPTDDDTLAHNPSHVELEQLRGRYGQTVSALRPAGITVFDGKRIDTLSEGSLIEPGQWVQCIDVRAGRVIVRKVAAPPRLEDIQL